MRNKLCLLLIIVLCTGCSNEENRKVNILNWSSYIPSDVILDFEK